MKKIPLMTVIIGGGQAGLATAYHLTRRDVPCVILDENEKVGAAWRKRWESLRLFTPGRYNSLPGMTYPGPPRSFPGKDDIANYLEAYASAFGFSVKTNVKVVGLKAESDYYIIESNEGSITTNNVVVATGPFHHPRIPEYTDKLNRNIVQLHSSEYQTPSQIPDGPVLIVGAGQSGAEIGLDMAYNDHMVYLSGRNPGEEPTVRGTFSDRLFTPVMIFAATKLFNVANPLGRKLRKQFFYPPRGIPRAGGTTKRLRQAGVECVGRTAGISEGYPQLEDGRVLKVNAVIWCTGFVTDYSWIELPIFDEYGFPTHHRGVVIDHPGLYFVGMPFQRTLSSTLIVGVGKDADYIAGHIASRRVV